MSLKMLRIHVDNAVISGKSSMGTWRLLETYSGIVRLHTGCGRSTWVLQNIDNTARLLAKMSEDISPHSCPQREVAVHETAHLMYVSGICM